MHVQRTQRRNHSSVHWNIIITVSLIGFFGIAAIAWVGIRDMLAVSNAFTVLRGSIQQVSSDISSYHYSRVGTELANAKKALDELDQLVKTAPTFTAPLSPLKRHGDAFELFLSQAKVVLKSTEELSRMGIPIARLLLQKEGDPHIRALSEQDTKKILDILSEGLPTLIGSNATLKLVQQRLSAIDDGEIPSSARPIKSDLLENVGRLQKGIENSIPVISIAPGFLGHNKEMTYLLLFQNTAETRGTGGFIGTYGTITLRNGNIIRFSTDNVYNLDDKAGNLSVVPPQPLQQYGNIKKWYLRDSNWSPDFPESARQAQWFYNQEGGNEKIDGVIALTPDVISSLMKIVGDISVDDLNFSSDQFTEQLQYQVEKGYESRNLQKSQRKDVIRLIADELIGRFAALPFGELPKIAGVLKARLAEKALMVYLIDQNLQEYSRSQQWSGEIIQTKGDSLMVVDSNIISLKTDAVMDKKIDYSVIEQDDGSLRAKIKLTYQNNGTYSWTTTTYRDYVRVLIPQDSKIISSSAPLEISREYGKMLLGRFLSIDPQKKDELTIEYLLPHTIQDQVRSGLYTLFVQKQSGISTQQFSFDARFRRPILSIEPPALSSSLTGDGGFDFAALLQTDKEIRLRFN